MKEWRINEETNKWLKDDNEEIPNLLEGGRWKICVKDFCRGVRKGICN